MQDKKGRLWTVVNIAEAVSVIATILLAFNNVLFFFVFVPISIGVPWFVKKLIMNRTRKQWQEEWR